MEQIIPFISEVGFPIVVTLYLLHRIESKLDVVVQSILNLADTIECDVALRPGRILIDKGNRRGNTLEMILGRLDVEIATGIEIQRDV